MSDTSVYDFNISSILVGSYKSNIFYVGQYGTSGYATAAKGYICEYFINKHNITWHPLKFDDSILSKDCYYNIIAESLINVKHSEYDCFIYHSTPNLWNTFNYKFKHLNENKKIIGYTTWETNILPKKWVDHINNEVQEICCPSKYNLETFKNSGVTIPIKVVPHIILEKNLLDKKHIFLYTNQRKVCKFQDGMYTFYTIGEFIERKGIEDTIHAFCQTFTDKDNVRLIIKTHYKDYSKLNKKYCLDKINTILNTYKNRPEIHFIINNLSENEILALHSIGDCYISLTKSEGFGLTIFDAFNYKKKIIVTGYGGHLDFLGNDHGGLIKYKLNNVRNMKEFSSNYDENTMWAYPDIEHFKELMRKMVN